MRVTKKIKEEQIRILGEVYKDTKPALIFRNPFELLIAVILSAQCTDKRVNVTTARLFQKAATPEAILSLGLAALEEEIRDCGLFRNKAKNIMATCQILCEQYGGEVPADFAKLQELPGVGRKQHWDLHLLAVAHAVHVYRIVVRAVLGRELVLLLGRQGLAHVPRFLRKVEKPLVAGALIRPKQALDVDDVADL